MPSNNLLLHLTNRQVLLRALKYAVVIALGFFFANLAAPHFDPDRFQEVELRSLLFGSLLGSFLSWLFFVAIFTLESWLSQRESRGE